MMSELMSQLSPEQFAKIYDDYAESIYRFLITRVNTKEVAQDITSETFMKAWDYIQSGRKDISNMRAFLFRIARNTVIDYYRGKQSKEVSLDDEQSALSNIPDTSANSDISDMAEINSDISQIQKYISVMNKDYADVLILHYVEDMPVSEIAEVIGKSEGAVRVMLHRALKELRGKMATQKP